MNVVRMNIAVPAELKEKMNAVNNQYNWSKIASEAFAEAVKRLEKPVSRSDSRP
jgi:hypothetical protein